MSVDINWDSIREDEGVNEGVKDFLNSRLQEFALPSYVSNLKVTNFELGSIPPNVTLKQMDDPLDEFYNYLLQMGDISEETSKDRNTDIQLLVELDYKGDMSIELSADLVLNYPSPQFMTLPVKLRISDIGMHCLCLLAYMKKQLFISFLCDVSDPLLEMNKLQVDPSGPNFMGKRALERISLIRNIKIHTELGEQDQAQGSVLRSVGKLEEFLVDLFRNLIRREAAWPSWIDLDFTPSDEEADEQEEQKEMQDEDGDKTDSLQDDIGIPQSSVPISPKTSSADSAFSTSLPSSRDSNLRSQ
ncbi:Mitochondrial distribution and morphology protein 12 [Kluyveromyces marxianus]|nr:Mitochondrial distribution and morphology protein 12 [Kluyveromyces marxianus]KAG0685535.1 Mitochondrial distribution and morphology protein 12 [Kluyveromyces marxianus]